MKTASTIPVEIEWDGKFLTTQCRNSIVQYTEAEAIELRDFLNQIDLTTKRNEN